MNLVIIFFNFSIFDFWKAGVIVKFKKIYPSSTFNGFWYMTAQMKINTIEIYQVRFLNFVSDLYCRTFHLDSTLSRLFLVKNMQDPPHPPPSQTEQFWFFVPNIWETFWNELKMKKKINFFFRVIVIIYRKLTLFWVQKWP